MSHYDSRLIIVRNPWRSPSAGAVPYQNEAQMRSLTAHYPWALPASLYLLNNESFTDRCHHLKCSLMRRYTRYKIRPPTWMSWIIHSPMSPFGMFIDGQIDKIWNTASHIDDMYCTLTAVTIWDVLWRVDWQDMKYGFSHGCHELHTDRCHHLECSLMGR